MREVHDIEHAKNHGKTQGEQGVKRPVYQAKHELPHQGLYWDTKKICHGCL